MNRLYTIVKTLFATLRKAPGDAVVVQVESEAGENRELEYYQLPGIASGPTPEDRAATVNLQGYRVVVGSHNYRVGVEVESGQTRIYSTPSDGSAVKGEVDLQTDGTITAKNDGGNEVEINSDGTISATSSSGGSAEISSAGAVTLTSSGGATIEIDAAGAVSITGTASAEVTAPTVTVNSGVQGAARMLDSTISDPTSDPVFWTWVAAVHAATGLGSSVTQPPTQTGRILTGSATVTIG